MQITLKDIAAQCGVSATTVSAVLNQRQGRIGYSEARRRQILEVAAKLDYHPNLLARSMVSRRSPMVGVMLNIAGGKFNSGHNKYFDQVFPPLTFKLNERNLEVLFVPYHDEEDQIARLDRLYKERLVGGIITNLIPQQYGRIAGKLSDLDLPYIILGYPQGFDCHCVYSIDCYDWLPEYEKSLGIKRSFLLIQHRNELQLLGMPFPESYYWLAEPVQIDEAIIRDPENLIICSGTSLYHKLSVSPRNAIIMEERRLCHELPERVPAVIIDSRYRTEIVDLVARNLADWMQTGKEPKIRKNQILLIHDKREFRF